MKSAGENNVEHIFEANRTFSEGIRNRSHILGLASVEPSPESVKSQPARVTIWETVEH